jgi:hypothetical protein
MPRIGPKAYFLRMEDDPEDDDLGEKFGPSEAEFIDNASTLPAAMMIGMAEIIRRTEDEWKKKSGK